MLTRWAQRFFSAPVFLLGTLSILCSNTLAPFVRVLPFVTSEILQHCLPKKELLRKNVAVPELIDGVFIGERTPRVVGDRPLKIPESVAPYF